MHFGKIPKRFSQNLANLAKFNKFLTNFTKFWKKSAIFSAIFNEKFEIREGRLGPLPHPLVSLVSTNHATTLNHVQTPWNFVEEFGIAGNPNKGHSVSSQLDQTES